MTDSAPCIGSCTKREGIRADDGPAYARGVQRMACARHRMTGGALWVLAPRGCRPCVAISPSGPISSTPSLSRLDPDVVPTHGASGWAVHGRTGADEPPVLRFRSVEAAAGPSRRERKPEDQPAECFGHAKVAQ